METKNLKQLGLVELTGTKLKAIDGGVVPWAAFVAGAIAGGLLYDAWKASMKGYVNGVTNGTVDPAIRPSRQPFVVAMIVF